MRAVIRKWGHSAAVRVPASILEEARMAIDQPVEVWVEEGRVVIEAVRTAEANLDQLLAGITVGNQHEEMSFGKPVGREPF